MSYTFEIPAGTTYVRFALFDEFTDGDDDLDLFLGLPGVDPVDIVEGIHKPGSTDEIHYINPIPGMYTVYVHAFQTDGPDAQYTLCTWLVGSTSAINMAVGAPSRARIGARSTIGLSFSGLVPRTKYLGSVAYFSGTSVLGTTIVQVDTP